MLKQLAQAYLKTKEEQDLENKKNATVKELNDTVDLMFEQYRIYEDAKAKASEEYGKYKKLEVKVMDLLENEGMAKYQTKSGTFTWRYSSSFKTPKTPEEKDAFFGYLKDKGVFDQMISVNSKTMNSYLKEQEEIYEESGGLEFKVPGIQATTTRTCSKRRSK